MDENVRKLRVGIFVLMAMVILGILILVNSEGWVPQYDVFVRSEQAPGVTVGTPIRKHGILIGRVKDVKIKDGFVQLRLGINRDEEIFENELCSIETESLLGDAVIKFLPLSQDLRGDVIGASYMMDIDRVAIKKDPMQSLASLSSLIPQAEKTLASIDQAAQEVKGTGKQVTELTNSIQKTIQDETGEFKKLITNLNSVSTKAGLALDSFEQLFENLASITGDPELKKDIKSAVRDFLKIFQEVRVAVRDTRDTIKKFGSIPDNVNGTLENMEAFTAELEKQGPEVLGSVKKSLENVGQFAKQLNKFAIKLESLSAENNSISKFLKDDAIYDDVRAAVLGVRETVANVREVSHRLKPLINDARIAVDKVARKPGILGAAGVFEKPEKAGYKGSAGRGRGRSLLRRE